MADAIRSNVTLRVFTLTGAKDLENETAVDMADAIRSNATMRAVRSAIDTSACGGECFILFGLGRDCALCLQTSLLSGDR